MQPLQICIGPTIHIGRESWCFPYAGFFIVPFPKNKCLRKNGRLCFTFPPQAQGQGRLVVCHRSEEVALVMVAP